MAKRRKATRKTADQRTAPTIENRSGESDPMAFAITTEPLSEPGYAALSRATKTELERLYQLARTNPRAAGPQLMAALMRYPQVPSIFNYLFVAYSAMGDIKRAEAIIRKSAISTTGYAVDNSPLCVAGQADGDDRLQSLDYQHCPCASASPAMSSAHR